MRRKHTGPGTIGEWSDSELAQFLKTDANPHGIAFGSMSDVIIHSAQYMTDQDALAMAKYLKTIHGPDDAPAVPFAYNAAEQEALKNGDARKPGAMTYLDNCAACRRPDGLGYERVFPRLAGNPDRPADALVRAMGRHRTAGAGSGSSRTPLIHPAPFRAPRYARRAPPRRSARRG